MRRILPSLTAAAVALVLGACSASVEIGDSRDDSSSDSSDESSSEAPDEGSDGGTEEGTNGGDEPSVVTAAAVEGAVVKQLTAQVGQEPDDVTCPDDLPAEVGASMTCLLTAGDGSTIDVDVEVTGVDGDDVSFDIRVAETANP